MTYKEKVAWLIQWAHENKLIFEEEGEVGLGYECVGMTTGRAYIDVDYGFSSTPFDLWRYLPEGERLSDLPEILRGDRRLAPFDDAPDYFDKHDCLAVRGRGREAVEQLYAWLHRLVEAGAFVEHAIPRGPPGGADTVELLLHGATRTRLTLIPWEDQQEAVEALWLNGRTF